MRSVTVKIFNLERKVLQIHNDCSAAAGENFVNLKTGKLPAGTYIYKIISIDEKGISHEMNGKFVKLNK